MFRRVATKISQQIVRFSFTPDSLRRAESFTESDKAADHATSSKFDSLRRSTNQLIRKTTSTAAAAADSRPERETTSTAESRTEGEEAAGRPSTAFNRDNSHNQEVILYFSFTQNINIHCAYFFLQSRNVQRKEQK